VGIEPWRLEAMSEAQRQVLRLASTGAPSEITRSETCADLS